MIQKSDYVRAIDSECVRSRDLKCLSRLKKSLGNKKSEKDESRIPPEYLIIVPRLSWEWTSYAELLYAEVAA